MKKAINQELMRMNNKRSILEMIQKNAPVSKAEISNSLGLSSTSVSTFINELSLENKIIHCGSAKSTGGRKSALYQINPHAFYVIGIDLEVDRIITVLTNAVGQKIAETETLFANHDEWHVISILNQTIHTIIKDNNISLEKVAGIGIGVPGIVQSNLGLIEFAPNFGWHNVNLRQLLNIDRPIFIENEANAGAIGEKIFGVAGTVSNFLYISVGLGIGCGLIINGKLFTGHSYHAGEFGHMTVEPAGSLCRCGNRGCWEVYASNDAAIKLYNRTGERQITTYEEFLDLAMKNDPPALEVLESITRYLGIGIASLINGLNPNMVIIGGKIVEVKEQINHKLLKHIKEHALDKTFSDFSLEFSRLKHQTAAMGMAGLALEYIMHDVSFEERR